ncbi:uncharacterized protein LOC127804460 isoform X3 [Diospyros lotus]|uniref:uncharacterized protein LOC127804460 isoform X3 n=1 Tax=Diospyros lotus TaxID=55363 RepID=UPI0022559CB9|nr:uncharacterized protein LOC127804460 isoform X3 [Diospyros lotus]
MEFVGKTLKKEFAGLGVFAGVVNSYDASTGFFEILYEDGDSEELELSEVSSLFNGAGLGTGSVTGDQSAAEFELANEPRVRRKPKKRRRLLADSGNRTSANFTSDSLTESREEIILRQDGTSQQGFSRDTVSAMGNLSSGGCNGVKPDNGLDLNVGLNLTEGFSLSEGANLNVHFEELPRRNGCIDLNLDANGELEELREGNLGNPGAETQKGKRCFDLNMVLDEEGKNSDSDCEGQLKETTSLHVVEETEKQEKEGLEMVGGVKNQEQACFGIVAGTQVEPVAGYAENDVGDSCVTMIKDAPKADGASGGSEGGGVPVTTYANDSIPSQVQVKKELPEGDSGIACKERNRRKSIKTSENISFIKETVLRRSSQRLAMVDSRVGFQEAVEREKGVSGEFLGGTTPGATVATGFLSSDVELKEGFTSTGTDTDTTADNSYQVNTGMTSKERQRKRRRKLSDSAVETVLRRSSRRLAASLNPQNHISSEATSVADNEAQSSAAVSAVLDEKLAIPDREESEEDSVLPPKLPLPPSSENLNLDGIPILDLFSVYACLRSFSTLLFLSPFELEDFVAALRCEAPNLLLDFIHVSLLKTLRKHLELLSGENSVSASNCLRSLNWDLLDVITWPIFMMEYLLIHGSALRPGFELCKLNVLESGYYKQPAPVKIEILQCLCDDVIEMQAIRSELDRRTQAIELNMDTDWSTKIEGSKRRRTSVDISGGSCLTEEVVDETTDWNSDECCLCKMDGSLICCDGCPAAYHLRCVGVSSNLMPEGDWYCPECMIDRDKPWLKLGKSIRGADLLGIDPHGRLYHSSCGYLLVSDSHENEQSYRYYNINDLGFVIEALKSLNTLYNPIIGAILKQWNISVYLNGAKSYKDSPNPTPCPELMKGQIGTVTMLPLHLAPSGTCPGEEIINERKPEENSTAAQYSGSTDFEVSALVNNAQVTSNNFVKMENLLTSSEGSAETSLATAVQNLQKTGPDGFNRSPGTLNGSEIQGKILSVGDSPLTSTNFDGEQGKNIQSAVCGHILSISDTRKGETPRRQVETSYMNYYSLAQTASSVAEELSHKSSEKINESSTKSVEDIILAQLKAISKKSTKFSWPNIQKLNADARKEKCGWCFSCKASDDERDCFFNLSDSAPTDLMNEVVGLCSQWNKKDHLVDVMGYILSIEDRLRGLLSGPWLNPHYSKLWRKNVANASDVTSLKHFLLMLESNLRPLALSADWVKHVDSVPILGSACHIVSSSLRVSSRHGMGRKRARYSDLEANNSSNAARGLGLLWWRGGRLSRKLFNWKGLPRSLALKAARQALNNTGGCTKVPGILYLDSSEFSRRSQHVAWRAAVEHSKSVEQLALQVRELDANIRWDDIENTNVLLKMDQFRKSVRPFKKVIIRRKCTEGAVVKYLLDFGKRRIIPDVVVTHGYTVEESSSGRKKYWLEESLVPLHLLKAFEEKRIARKSNKMSSGKLNASGRITRKISRNRGFEYLFAKAEKSEYYQCGHCKKDVLIRSDSCEDEPSYRCYHRNDLSIVIEALKSANTLYHSIVGAILKQWNISVYPNGADGSNRSSGTLNGSEIQGKILSVGDCPLTSTSFDSLQGKNIHSAEGGHILFASDTRKDDTSRRRLETSYMNFYSHAQTVSWVAEELAGKSSEKINESSRKSVENIILTQMKAISKKSTIFLWPNIQKLNPDARKEKCGWCFSCKSPDYERDCLFNLSAPTYFTNKVLGLCSKWKKKGHLADVVGYIVSIELRLHGLLSGPWLNPHHSKLWRNSVVKASDITSLKHFLLMLESNLRPLALSAEWVKPVDSVSTMGSACHSLPSSLSGSSRHGMGRKRARYLDLEVNQSSNSARGLGLFWWRGGRLSRELFNWKVLPRTLALKAARQGGCMKMLGISYPITSEYARRSHNIAWRAAVEHSKSVEQLALQVRELDANIRWDDIENTNILSKLVQFRKSVRPFKNVRIRQKCIEGTVLKYLLDFGKRRMIPDVVVSHGSMVEESSSGRKKYWLEESLVPLHLLKAFEEERIAYTSNKVSSGKLNGSGRLTKKISKKGGFEYLFSKAETFKYYQCAHCKKDVLIRKETNFPCKQDEKMKGSTIHSEPKREFPGTKRRQEDKGSSELPVL